ncbi:conserved hypothetical protein [Desulfarculales bacterium]
MATNHLETRCPSWLEDECFIIETSGEMPEVALQEVLLSLPKLAPGELDCLRTAVVLGYLRIIGRDLEYDNLGRPHFRGLERAQQNLTRLRGFLHRVAWELPPATRQGLAEALEAYLTAEEQSLRTGRDYASSPAGLASCLLADLGLDPQPWRGLLERLLHLPAPDFRGLMALKRLKARGAVAKRRRRQKGAEVIEVLESREDGQVLAGVSLPLLGLDERQDPVALARAEMVWSLLDLPEAT